MRLLFQLRTSRPPANGQVDPGKGTAPLRETSAAHGKKIPETQGMPPAKPPAAVETQAAPMPRRKKASSLFGMRTSRMDKRVNEVGTAWDAYCAQPSRTTARAFMQAFEQLTNSVVGSKDGGYGQYACVEMDTPEYRRLQDKLDSTRLRAAYAQLKKQWPSIT